MQISRGNLYLTKQDFTFWKQIILTGVIRQWKSVKWSELETVSSRIGGWPQEQWANAMCNRSRSIMFKVNLSFCKCFFYLILSHFSVISSILLEMFVYRNNKTIYRKDMAQISILLLFIILIDFDLKEKHVSSPLFRRAWNRLRQNYIAHIHTQTVGNISKD